MTIYNFKKESKVYIVKDGIKYALIVYPDITFSQTFDESPVKVKTLHAQRNMFDKAVITKANPANFNFTVPLITQEDVHIVNALLLDYDDTTTETRVKSFDLYIESNSVIYKLEKAVMETGTYRISRESILLLTVSGTASKLYKFTDTIPGTLSPPSDYLTYNAPNILEAKVGGVEYKSVTSVSIEVNNSIDWVDYGTLHDSLYVTNASDTMYPGAFVVTDRVLSGNIQLYVTDENSDRVQGWNTNIPLRVRAGNTSSNYIIDVNIPGAVYTNRVEMSDMLMQSFDFRMVTSPDDLSDVVRYLYAASSLGFHSGIWAAI